MHGPAAEALPEGAEYGAETGDVAGSSDAAAAAGMRPPRPVDWAAAGAAGAAEDGQMGNASAEAAMTAAAGAAEDRPGAPLAITHGPAAEVLYEGAECDVYMRNAAKAPVAAAAAGMRPPRPSNWGSMTKHQKKTWRRCNERKEDGMGL